MRLGITLLGDRVAPRCTFAESILIVVKDRGRITHRETVQLENNTIIDLMNVLRDYKVETLVCGGISVMEIRELVQSLDIAIVDNVAGDIDEIIKTIRVGTIHPGYGLQHLGTTSLK